jgi:hypothetical protein
MTRSLNSKISLIFNVRECKKFFKGDNVMMDVNFLAVIVGAVLYFVIGMIWYSPQAFGKIWMQAHQVSEGEMKGCYKAMAGAFVIGLVLSYVMARFMNFAHIATFMEGAMLGFWAWLGFVLTTHFSGVLWEKKPINLYLLHMGCLFVTFLAIGGLLGAWR